MGTVASRCRLTTQTEGVSLESVDFGARPLDFALAPARARKASFAEVLYRVTQRPLDIALSALLLVVLAPALLLIAVVIWADSGLPLIYRSERLGRHRRPITVLKFRTMRDGSHHHLTELLTLSEERRMEYEASRKLKDDPRRTRVGTFLRRTSLDELPQLWNVLRGEMSLIGPRPCVADELDGRPEAAAILSVRPGITGLWQVNGRSDVTFEDRMWLDVTYIRHRGFVLDAKILIRTISAVVTGRGAY
jgi:exopolysaccharide production protein ExoY